MGFKYSILNKLLLSAKTYKLVSADSPIKNKQIIRNLLLQNLFRLIKRGLKKKIFLKVNNLLYIV